MLTTTLKAFADSMTVVAAEVGTAARHGQTVGGLSTEASAMAALIGAISYIRANGLPEERIMREALRAVPVAHQVERIVTVQPS